MPQLKERAPVLTAVSTIDPLTHSMCGLITLSTVESTNNEPPVEVGTISNETLIFIDVAFSCGLNLMVSEFHAAVKS